MNNRFECVLSPRVWQLKLLACAVVGIFAGANFVVASGSSDWASHTPQVAPTLVAPASVAPVPIAAISEAPFVTTTVGSCTTSGCATMCNRHCCSGTIHAICQHVKAVTRAPAHVPPPNGTYTRQAFETQRQNALAEYFVLYREDFLNDEVELNETGLRHLDGIVRRMNQIGAPIKIEPTGKAELDELRRLKVTDSIVKLAGDPNRVQSGTTRAEGLRSEDITVIGSRFYSAGTGFGSGGGGFGGGVGGYGR